jgi:hypothetical protein
MLLGIIFDLQMFEPAIMYRIPSVNFQNIPKIKSRLAAAGKKKTRTRKPTQKKINEERKEEEK